MPLKFSPAESARFGLSLWRLDALEGGQIAEFFSECINLRPDVVILRLKTMDAEQLYPLLARACHTIAADTLLEFHKTLKENTIADLLESGTEIIEVREHNISLLDGLVERCYQEYRNHYFANPCLDTKHVLTGLVEFSRGFVSREGRTVFVALKAGTPCGYLCMEISGNTGSTVIGGSALDIPQALRHKVLCDLTHHGDLWLMKQGIKKFRAVTRTDKVYIQKLLIRNMHCMPADSLTTLHMNLFLNKILSAPETRQTKNAAAPRYGCTRFDLRQAKGSTNERTHTLTHDNLAYTYGVHTDNSGVCSLFSEIRGA